jgi:hypothetical protein
MMCDLQYRAAAAEILERCPVDLPLDLVLVRCSGMNSLLLSSVDVLVGKLVAYVDRYAAAPVACARSPTIVGMTLWVGAMQVRLRCCAQRRHWAQVCCVASTTAACRLCGACCSGSVL